MTFIHYILKAWQLLLYNGSLRLRGYETLCIDAWKEKLSDDAAALLQSQLKLLEVNRRYAKDKLLCLYPLVIKTRENWPRSILFPCDLDEVAVARITLGTPGRDASETNIAEIKLSHGRFFGLEFKEPPKPLLKGARVEAVTVMIDPMEPFPHEANGLDERQRDKLLTTINATLPEEYRAMGAITGSMVINGWQINNVTHIRKIAQFDGNFYVIAEKEGLGIIGLREGSRTGQSYYVGNEDARPVEITTPLAEFIHAPELAPKYRFE